MRSPQDPNAYRIANAKQIEEIVLSKLKRSLHTFVAITKTIYRLKCMQDTHCVYYALAPGMAYITYHTQ